MPLTALTDIASCRLALDAASGVSQDAAGTTPATTDGQPARRWLGTGPDAVAFATAADSALAVYRPNGFGTGKPALEFDATVSRFVAANTAISSLSASSYTIVLGFRVQYQDPTAGSTGAAHTLIGKTQFGTSRLWLTTRDQHGGGGEEYNFVSRYDGFVGGRFDHSRTSSPTESAHVVTYSFDRLDDTHGTETFWVDGQIVARRTGVVLPWDFAHQWVIGGTDYAPPGDVAFRLPALLGQIGIFYAVLSDADRMAAEDLVRTKIGITPAFEESPTRSRQLIVAGNSLPAGFGLSVGTGLGDLVIAQANRYDYAENFAYSGQTISQSQASADSQLAPVFTLAPQTGLVYLEAVNEMRSNGTTGAASYTKTVDLCAAYTAAGARVAVCTCSPAGSLNETYRTDLNAALRADFTVATSNPLVFRAGPGVSYAKILVDVAADTVMGQAGQNLNTTYYSDGTHYTAAGAARLAPALAYAANQLYPQTSLSPPTGLSGLAGNTIGRLTWTAVPGEVVDAYDVQQSTDGGTTWTTAAGSPLAATALDLHGLTNGTAHSFRVRSTDNDGNASAYTSSLSVTPGVPGSGSGGGLRIVTQRA